MQPLRFDAGRTDETTNTLELAAVTLGAAKVVLVTGEAIGTPGRTRLLFALGDTLSTGRRTYRRLVARP